MGAPQRKARSHARDDAQLRAWLAYVVETAIDMLDQIDAPTEDREDDERERYMTDDGAAA